MSTPIPIQSFFDGIQTPAFIYDEAEILDALRRIRRVTDACGCKLLYTLKAFAIADGLKLMAPQVSGFSASSLFEALLARECLGDAGSIHITSPGLRATEAAQLMAVGDFLAFNSISQWQGFRDLLGKPMRCGLRVNPKLPFVEDDRYNPCRKFSKLGVPVDQLGQILGEGRAALEEISGLHFHTNYGSVKFEPLRETVRVLEQHVPRLLEACEWVNMGGGYLFPEASDTSVFRATVERLKSKYNLDVFIEPSTAIVRECGYIVASVLDTFESDGKQVAVLDTAITHMTDVFEYQYRPKVLGDSEHGKHRVLLAGSTCLAGDLFGEYAFEAPLQVGAKVVFQDMGSYTMTKTNWFNGMPLPNIYALTTGRELLHKKSFTYASYKDQIAMSPAPLR